MNRRHYLTLVGGMTAAINAGCLGDEELIDGDADEYILSTSQISNILPGEWEFFQERDPEIDPVGLSSVEIIQLLGPNEDDILDYGVALFDEIEAAETFYDDEYSAMDDPRDEELGDDAFAITSEGYTALSFRYANVWVQIFGTPHVSNQRELARKQIDKF